MDIVDIHAVLISFDHFLKTNMVGLNSHLNQILVLKDGVWEDAIDCYIEYVQERRCEGAKK